MRRTSLALVVTTAAALVLAGCGGGSDAGNQAVSVDAPSSALRGTAITAPYPLPDERFTDTAGRPFVPAGDAKAPVTLVFFGYTHCPDVCNVVLANVASALRRTDDTVRDRTQLLFVTTDPERDSGAVLRDYLDRFDTAYVGLRAPLPTMKSAAASLHIAYGGKSADASGGYEVEHGTHVTAFRDGKAAVVWSAETSVADLRADLTRLASG